MQVVNVAVSLCCVRCAVTPAVHFPLFLCYFRLLSLLFAVLLATLYSFSFFYLAFFCSQQSSSDINTGLEVALIGLLFRFAARLLIELVDNESSTSSGT